MKNFIKIFISLSLLIVLAFNVNYEFIEYRSDADGKIFVDIRDFGAVGNGFEDDSPAIQRAIDAAEKVSGTVVIPGGLFRMQSSVKVPSGVRVLGTLGATTGPWQDYLDSADKGGERVFGSSAGAIWISEKYMHGSWILADNGLGDINSDPTFLLDKNTSISKIGFISSSMSPATSHFNHSPPVIGVYAERLSSNAGSGIVIDNISLSNTYYGIAVVSGSDLNNYYIGQSGGNADIGEVIISNIMGAPMYKGIVVKGISSPVVMNNLQFNYSCYITSHVNMRMQMATDVELSNASDVTIENMLTFGAYSGITTKPAYSSRQVNLKATNLNLEGQKALRLLSSGNYDIYNSYFFMVNFAEAAVENEFRGIEIRQDVDSGNTAVYNFTNCVIQNPVIFSQNNNSRWEDIHLDIELGGNATANFINIQTWGHDDSNKHPIIRYHRLPGSNTKVRFSNINFTTAFSNPLVVISGRDLQPGEMTFKYSRFPESADLSKSGQAVFINCTAYNNFNHNTVYDTSE